LESTKPGNLEGLLNLSWTPAFQIDRYSIARR